MLKVKWAETDDEDLRRMYCDELLPVPEIAARLNRSKSAVNHRVAGNGLSRQAIDTWSDQDDEELRRLYVDRTVSAEEIGRRLGRSHAAVVTRAIKLGIKKARPRGYDVVEDYFDVIDTDEKAYWLGFFAADGGLIKRTQVRINLKNGDVSHLERIRDLIAPKAQVLPDPSEPRRHYFQISCRHMADTLRHHGMSPNVKTYDLCWPPELPEERKLAFFAGYFDGDGSLMWSARDKMWYWEVCGCETMMRQFEGFVRDELEIDVTEPKLASGSKMLFRLRTSGSKAEGIDAAISSIPLGMKRKRISHRTDDKE